MHFDGVFSWPSEPFAAKFKPVLIPQEVYEGNGKSWDATKRALIEILGTVKESTIARWIQLGRDWDAEVSDHCAGWKCINMSYIIGNDYLTPSKAHMKLKLQPEWGIAAFELVKDKNVGKHMVSADVCAPIFNTVHGSLLLMEADIMYSTSDRSGTHCDGGTL